MHKRLFRHIALIGIVCFSPANGSSIATITGIKSPAWLLQSSNKTELRLNSNLNIGDHIITGDIGRVEMQIWSNVILRLYANSEIRILAEKKTELTVSDNQSELYVHKGRLCVIYKPQPDTKNIFILNVGNTIVTAIHHQGHICVLRQEGMSSIELRDGSVQITHSVDPDMIILSETGTEFRIDDEGSYELLIPATDDVLTLEIEAPFIADTDFEKESPGDPPDTVDGEVVLATENAIKESKPATKKNVTNYIYTVYLFSTRSENVASQVNTKFQKAGHKTEILVSEKDSATRYRIAVSGFKSLQSAKVFAKSMVGKLGISDTWVGKEKQKIKN